jgi:hypothetical protein
MSDRGPRRVFICQTNYIPWKGYFDAIHHCDEFVLYDDMQYTGRDWRNRNKVKTPKGSQWMTIPLSKHRRGQRICEIRAMDSSWATAHWSKLERLYRDASCFEEVEDFVSELYQRAASLEMLSDINHLFLREICNHLGISTRFHWSRDFELAEDRNQRLVDICLGLGADEYWSGPAAQAYVDESLFTNAGIKVEYFDYGGYPEYPQLFPPFDHAVSILDLIFNTGSRASEFMNSFGSQPWRGQDR